MAVTLVNLTFDLADLIGGDFDTRRTKVWIETNVEGNVVIDSTNNLIRLGDATASINSDGTGSFVGLVATDSTTNPTAFQYKVHIDYARAGHRDRATWDSGWFSIAATSDLADIAAEQYVPPTFNPWSWRGAWDSGTAYSAGNLVSYDGSTWKAVTASTNVTPIEGASWTLVAQAGDQGLPGPGSAAWTAAQAVTVGSVRQAPDGSWIKSTANRTTSASFTNTPDSPPVLAAPTTATTGGAIAAGTTYYYRATALSAIGETLGSAEVSAAIAAALATPVNAGFATATTGGTLAPGTYSYRVSATNALGQTLASTATTIAIPAALAAPVLAAPTTATTGGTLAASTYYYEITATNAVGETVGSNEVSQVTTGTTSTVGLSWAAVAGATGYKVYRATTAGGESTSPALIATLGAVTAYTDTGTATSAGAVPATNTTATTTNTVTVNWGAVAGATGYKVYGRVAGSELLIATVGAVTTYTDTGAVTPAGALPTANTTATNTNAVGLSWAAVAGATGYKVYRATTAGGESTSPALIATLGAVTAYTDTGAAAAAGAVPATSTATEQGFWTPVSTTAGTQEQAALAATYVATVAAPTGVAATDTANLQAAIAALPNGGIVRLRRGNYALNATLAVNTTNGLTIEGESTILGGASTTIGTSISYSAASGPAIDLTSTIGFNLRRVQLIYTNAAFTGSLIRARTSGQQLLFDECTLTGSAGATGASELVYLDEVTQVTFRRVCFARAVNGVSGGSGALGVQIVRFYDCNFGHSSGTQSLSGYSINNPNRTWVFYGCNFEASASGYPNALGYSGGISYGEGIGFFGCYFGDIVASAVPTAWIDYNGASRVALTLHGNNVELGNVHSFVKFGKLVAQEGLSAHGNFFYGAAPDPIDIGEYATGVDIDGNRHAGGSPAGANLDKSRAFRYAMGDNSANITTVSGTATDVLAGPAGAALSVDIAARPGDVLDIEFTCLWSHSAVGQAIFLYLAVNGTTRMTTVDTYTGAYSLTATVRCQHVVTAADLTNGLVTVKPQWATTAGTVQIGNSGGARPSFSVTNRGR